DYHAAHRPGSRRAHRAFVRSPLRTPDPPHAAAQIRRCGGYHQRTRGRLERARRGMGRDGPRLDRFGRRRRRKWLREKQADGEGSEEKIAFSTQQSALSPWAFFAVLIKALGIWQLASGHQRSSRGTGVTWKVACLWKLERRTSILRLTCRSLG